MSRPASIPRLSEREFGKGDRKVPVLEVLERPGKAGIYFQR